MNPVKCRQDQIQNADLLPFCLLKLTKYLKILSVRMNISNTNEYLFPMLYTCINYNPPMYPYNYQQTILPGGGYHCVSDILVIINLSYI